MHEMSLMHNLLYTAEQALTPYRVARVRRLQVRAGILANILPAAFQFAFEALSQHTVFAGAELEVEKAPLEAYCLDCGLSYCSMTVPPQCPFCSGRHYRIGGGTEVLLVGIDFDEIAE